MYKWSNFSSFPPSFGVIILFVLDIQIGVQYDPIVVLICIYCVVHDCEPLIVSIVTIIILSFVNCFSPVFFEISLVYNDGVLLEFRINPKFYREPQV